MSLFALLGLVACNYREVTYLEGDAAELCIAPAGFEVDADSWDGVMPKDEVVYDALKGVKVMVVFHHALSECDEFLDPTCRVSFDGNDIFVESSGTIRFHKDRRDCDTRIVPAIASCDTPPLEEGSYAFHHGAASVNLLVPSTNTVECQPVDEGNGCSTAPIGGLAVALGALAWLRRRKA